MREWGVFPYVPINLYWRIIQYLTYSAHGGSGYNFTRADVLEMSWAEAHHYLEALGEMRQKEAAAIEAASRG